MLIYPPSLFMESDKRQKKRKAGIVKICMEVFINLFKFTKIKKINLPEYIEND